MAGILATLGGIPLELANGDPGWLITSGVVPYRRAFEVHKDTAAQLMELSGEPVELFLPATSDDGEDRTIKQLYVMRSMPGSHPDKRRVEVADQRVYWPDVHVERDYNVRRNAGDTFLEGDNFNAAELELTVIYVPTSIVEGVPYTALEAVIDVLSELTFRSGNSFSFQDDVPDHVMEELKLRDNGDAAVARVLREFPGVSVYPHPDGDIRVYDQHRNTLEAFSGDVTQTESASLSGFHWPGFGSADVAVFSDRRGERAPLVRVLFGCRHEMLLVGTDSGSVTLGPGANAFRVLNVAPSPDRFLEAVPTRLTADGQLKVRNLSELTWCEFGLQATEGLLKAWSDDEVSNGVLTIADGGLGSLTQAILRSHRASGFQFV